jgi:hypothetical protein
VVPSTRIAAVENERDLRRFVDLPYRLYRKDPVWVPPLRAMEIAQFRPEKNPAFEFSRTRLFIAYEDGRVVGRVAALIVDRALERWNRKCGRIGWFECEESEAAAAALLDAAEKWLVSEGMEEVSGPLGFTDNDPTGLVVEGFDEMPTIAAGYNPPYYNDFLLHNGYSKEVDYVEYRITVPEEIPERVTRIAEMIRKRTGVRVFNEKSRKALARKWGHAVFDVLNEAYAELYGTSLLSENQIRYYISNYLGQVDPEFIKLAADGDRLVGFIIAMPNLSRAFRKARGRLFPFGFIHILREMKRSRVLDFYLAGIRKQYQNTGVDVLLSHEMAVTALSRHMEYAESNHELESNAKIQSMWKHYERRLHRRARVYNKKLEVESRG